VVLWVLWVEVVVNFMGFDPDGRGGFFSWWCWVSCGRDSGDGWLKERDNEEKINRAMGEKGERERD